MKLPMNVLLIGAFGRLKMRAAGESERAATSSNGPSVMVAQ